MIEDPERGRRADPMLSTQLEHVLLSHGPRILVVKMVANEPFAAILGALQLARPDAQIVSLVSGSSVGAEEEVGEVLRPTMGRRARLRRLSQGFHVCLIAVDPRQYGGIRRLTADTVSLASRAPLKIVCSQRQVLSIKGRTASVLAPIASASTLALGFLTASVLAALTVVVAGIAALLGEALLRLLWKARHPH